MLPMKSLMLFPDAFEVLARHLRDCADVPCVCGFLFRREIDAALKALGERTRKKDDNEQSGYRDSQLTPRKCLAPARTVLSGKWLIYGDYQRFVKHRCSTH